jgi:glycosyltransferase involved in cell wall biosynthesis
LIESGVTTSRVITMSNFLPLNQKYGFNENYEDYILYFGRFSKEKGIITLLKAQKLLNGKHKMVLVGAGPFEHDIKEYIYQNKIINVELPGPIYGAEMEIYLEKARVIIVPSEWYENCPYAILQSMAKGKVVIASRIGGLPELISDNETGLLFTAGDANSLASKIEDVFNLTKEEYKKMSIKIVDKTKKNHYWEHYIDELIIEYKRMIENK